MDQNARVHLDPIPVSCIATNQVAPPLDRVARALRNRYQGSFNVMDQFLQDYPDLKLMYVVRDQEVFMSLF